MKHLTHSQRRRAIRTLLLIWIGAILLGAMAGFLARGRMTPTALRDWVESLGVAGPALFILFSALAPLVLIPVAPLTLAAALLFAWPWSLVWVVVARNTSANLGFWLAHRLGRERVARLAGADLEEFVSRLRRRGLMATFMLRMLPVAPFSAVSYAAGVSGIRWRDYAFGSFLGMTPGSVVTLSTLALVLQ